MTRFLLVVAMVVSLWPIGAVVAIGSSNSNERQRHASDGGQAAEPETTGSASSESAVGSVEQNLAQIELKPIVSSAHRLNDDFRSAELRAGEPQPDYASRAEAIEKELKKWRDFSGPEASVSDVEVSNSLIDLMQAMDQLATSPTEESLGGYNAAIARFNALIE
jgi:hypothetical protein